MAETAVVSETAVSRQERQLRVCCYGSSSSKTPQKFLDEAYQLGKELAKRGHVCVNGGGRYGCMGAMNDGAADGNGTIVGVIHECFVVDHGTCHDIFSPTKNNKKNISLVTVGGNDLQERKRLLVQDADAIIVLPGGPGTWDELWEMACVKQLGMCKQPIPIVCINIDQFYKPFEQMLEQAHSHQLLSMSPSSILHLEPSSEKAIQYIERILCNNQTNTSSSNNSNTNKTTTAITNFTNLVLPQSCITLFTKIFTNNTIQKGKSRLNNDNWLSLACMFAVGTFFGRNILSKQN